MSRDYEDAVRFVAENQKASTSFLKQHLRLSDSKVGRFLRQMEKDGVISKVGPSGARTVLVERPAPIVPVASEDAMELVLDDSDNE